MQATTPLHCLVVEDEPLAAALLEDFIQRVPGLRFVGRCPDAVRAGEALEQQPTDVLFLDIHLPGLKGLDFLRSLPHPPQTILTTAYHEYALQGYDLDVVDYLLKPIGFERFMQAVRKLRRADTASPGSSGWQRERPFHFFNVNKKMVRVWLDEIVVVESLKEYVRIFLKNDDSLTTKFSMTSLEEMLPAEAFLRVHRSFLVALPHVEAYSPTEVVAGGRSTPVGRQYRERVLEVLSGM